MRTYKAAVTRIARKDLKIDNIWQRNYYEHIIRNENELSKIYNYIQTNPLNWPSDPEYIQ